MQGQPTHWAVPCLACVSCCCVAVPARPKWIGRRTLPTRQAGFEAMESSSSGSMRRVATRASTAGSFRLFGVPPGWLPHPAHKSQPARSGAVGCECANRVRLIGRALHPIPPPPRPMDTCTRTRSARNPTPPNLTPTKIDRQPASAPSSRVCLVCLVPAHKRLHTARRLNEPQPTIHLPI